MTWSLKPTIAADWGLSIPELPVDNWWFCAIVLFALMIGIWLVARYVTSVTEESDPAEIDRQMLTAVAELKSRGELTSEEYRSIKSQLVHRLAENPPESDSEDSNSEVQADQENKGSPNQLTDTSERKFGSEESTEEDAVETADLKVAKDQNDDLPRS
jgi:Mg-chelatase subunit ChlI